MTPGPPEFAAVLLAGGASTRMGAPKPLLQFEGETFLDRLVRLFSPHCHRVIAVLGYQAETVARGLQRPGVPVLVLNPKPECGQLSSLQTGLRALSARPTAVFFHPVDIPAIQEETIIRLCAAWETAPAGTLVLQPRHRGRKGHPVLLAATLIPELLALPPEGSARDVLRRHVERTIDVDVEDPGILRDADTPEDYRRLTGEISAP